MIKKLDWDSHFFSKKIGKLEVGKSFDKTDFYNKAKAYDMVYLFSDSPISINAKLMDIKCTYSKTVQQCFARSSSISIFNSNLDNYNELLALAFLSGHESRFLKDPFFDPSDFKLLYKSWIDKNLSEANTQVLVYKIKDEIVGFVSFSKNKNNSAIELIAVNAAFQGLGIGNFLIQEVENQLSYNSVLSVPTQKSNIGACKFYTNYGFKIINKKYIYHYAI